MTVVGNADPTPAGGVGLVVDLEGTGGDPVADNYRTELEEQLNRLGVKDVKRELANPNHALVVVTAMIPPGCVKGDPIDVEVALPERSGKATSLAAAGSANALLPTTATPKTSARTTPAVTCRSRGLTSRSARGRCWWALATATKPRA